MIPLGVLASARVAAGGATPPVSGYRAWWDFSDAATLTLSGSEITAAADKSGNGYHLAKMTTGPTLTPDWPGTSLSYAQSDGTNLRGLTNAAGASLTGDWTCFAAAFATTTLHGRGNSDVLASVRTLSTYKAVAATPLLQMWRGSVASTISTTGSDITGQQVHVRALSGSAHSYWLTTALKVGGVAGGSGGAGPVELFAEQAKSNGSDWNIGEVIIYPSALSQSDRESVVAYLQTKWGIA